MASFVANSYANTINEEDLFTNHEGVLSINKKDFLKEVVDEDLNADQKERFEYIVNKREPTLQASSNFGFTF